MLCQKLKRAEAGLRTTKKVYDEHCVYVGKEKQQLYLDKQKIAQEKRGEALRIYEVSSADGQPASSICCIANLTLLPSPHSS